jgi:hypothetical protein
VKKALIAGAALFVGLVLLVRLLAPELWQD